MEKEVDKLTPTPRDASEDELLRLREACEVVKDFVLRFAPPHIKDPFVENTGFDKTSRIK